MPTQIDCPECEGTGETDCPHESHWIDSMSACYDCIDGLIDCPDCDQGKITVYTESEMQEQRDLILYYENFICNTMRIASDIVEDEREALRELYIKESDRTRKEADDMDPGMIGSRNQLYGQSTAFYLSAEAIRSRGE